MKIRSRVLRAVLIWSIQKIINDLNENKTNTILARFDKNEELATIENKGS